MVEWIQDATIPKHVERYVPGPHGVEYLLAVVFLFAHKDEGGNFARLFKEFGQMSTANELLEKVEDMVKEGKALNGGQQGELATGQLLGDDANTYNRKYLSSVTSSLEKAIETGVIGISHTLSEDEKEAFRGYQKRIDEILGLIPQNTIQ